MGKLSRLLDLISYRKSLDYQRDMMQASILSADSSEARQDLWRIMKLAQDSPHSWLRFLQEGCGVSSVTVEPEAESTLALLNDQGREVPLHLLLDPGVGFKALVTKQYDAGNLDFFESRLNAMQAQSVTMVDIGANIGLFSRQCVSRFGDKLKQLFSYEPNQTIFPILEKNLAGISRVSLTNAGIGDRSGELTFYVDDKHPSSSSLLSSAVPDDVYAAKPQTVSILAAYEQVQKWRVEDSALFYKSDTQGFDQAIACNLGVAFFEGVSAAILEIFPQKNDQPQPSGFELIVECFPHRATLDNASAELTTAEVMEKVTSGKGFDLILWR